MRSAGRHSAPGTQSFGTRTEASRHTSMQIVSVDAENQTGLLKEAAFPGKFYCLGITAQDLLKADMFL